VVRALADRIDLVNVRDEWTAGCYDFADVSVTPCPCVVDVRARFRKRATRGETLFACHTDLMDRDEAERILDILRAHQTSVRYTDNIQRAEMGVDDIIARHYCGSSLVITSRLHGAIISYALGIPYVAVDRDTKIAEFARMYGNGVAVPMDEIGFYLEPGRVQTDAPIQFEDVVAFAARVRGWLRAHGASMRPTTPPLGAIPAPIC
jgi:polysaccharide pyruvyl transferase